MNAKLAQVERESISRVSDALEAERQAVAGTPLAAMWGDWNDAIAELRDKEPVSVQAAA